MNYKLSWNFITELNLACAFPLDAYNYQTCSPTILKFGAVQIYSCLVSFLEVNVFQIYFYVNSEGNVLNSVSNVC